MKNDVLNSEFKKQHELIAERIAKRIAKRQDDFLLSQVEKIRSIFMESGIHCDPDLIRFAKDIAPFVVIKTTHGDYRDGLVEATVKLEASEYLKAFMKLDLFNCDDSFVSKGELE